MLDDFHWFSSFSFDKFSSVYFKVMNWSLSFWMAVCKPLHEFMYCHVRYLWYRIYFQEKLLGEFSELLHLYFRMV